MRSVVGRPGGGSLLCCWFVVRPLPPVAVSLGPASVSRLRVRFGMPPRGTATATATSEIVACVPLCFPIVLGFRFRCRVSGSRGLRFQGLGRSVSELGFPLVFLRVFFKFSVLGFGSGFGSRVSVLISGFGFRFLFLVSGFGFLLFCLGFPVFSGLLLVSVFGLLVVLFGLRGPGLGLPSYVFVGLLVGLRCWGFPLVSDVFCSVWAAASVLGSTSRGPGFGFEFRVFLFLCSVLAPISCDFPLFLKGLLCSVAVCLGLLGGLSSLPFVFAWAPVVVSLGPASVSRWRARFGRPPGARHGTTRPAKAGQDQTRQDQTTRIQQRSNTTRGSTAHKETKPHVTKSQLLILGFLLLKTSGLGFRF